MRGRCAGTPSIPVTREKATLSLRRASRAPLPSQGHQVSDAHIFRPWGWRVVLIVSDNLKQALEQEGLTGLKFTEV
ncbi:hypothetical protein F0U60_23885 [Archangium minus]|uniref:Immunity MXAN-0049 protein domain-containing protein n=1 Tax=Archangium minus TaxID=83450 RepID=A0ABY9WVR0_9BACT|nr:hypothetical protein F0U60_23885 [Archangium minus]